MNFTSFKKENAEVFVYKRILKAFDISENNQRDAVCYFSTIPLAPSFISLKINIGKWSAKRLL